MAEEGRLGVSWRDVIVVIVVLNLAIFLGLPAIEYAREAARRNSCANNLSRIGLALHAYHDQYACLPPAALWSTAELNFDQHGRLERTKDSLAATYANWLQLLLPALDEAQLAGEFDAAAPVTAPSNRDARLTPLAAATCPSDTYNRGDNLYRVEFSDGASAEFARGNYAINGGTHVSAIYPGYLAYPITSGNMMFEPDADDDQFQWWGTGIAGFNRCFSLEEFTNGQSTLAAVDEIRAGITPVDLRGAWALGQIGSSITWAHGVHGDAFGPNNPHRDSDDILGGKELRYEEDYQQYFDEGMPFCDHCSLSNQATSRSLHPGGVNVLMLDGRVHFVSDAVNPSVWHVLHDRETPVEILGEDVTALLTGDVGGDEAPSTALAEAASPEAEEIRNSLGMKFVKIPAGEFLMGAPDQGNRWPFPSEAIQHDVTISRPYYLGVHEVRQRDYEQVMGTNPSWHAPGGGGAELVEGIETDDLPVENVTWNDATEFCRRLNEREAEKASGRVYRLPTEAEWERACRGGSDEAVEFDLTWNDAATTGVIAGKNRAPDGSFAVPSAVGAFPANPYGLHDMRGNVFEWCQDWFARDYYSRSPAIDPQGPASGYLKIIRGWDWVFVGQHCKDYLTISEPWRKSRYVGFRVVCEIRRVPHAEK